MGVRRASGSADVRSAVRRHRFGAVLGSLIAGYVIDLWYTAADGSKDWQGIWTAFALYALAMTVAFVLLFKHRHAPVAEAPVHGAADVNNP